MSVKIQINSLEALERLIGGDTELEIDIRQSIVTEFTKKHLKSLAETAATKEIGRAISTEITLATTESYMVETGFGRKEIKTRLRGALRELVTNIIKTELNMELNNLVREQLGRDSLSKDLKHLIESQATYIREEWTSKNIEQRISDLADQRIKQRLGLK